MESFFCGGRRVISITGCAKRCFRWQTLLPGGNFVQSFKLRPLPPASPLQSRFFRLVPEAIHIFKMLPVHRRAGFRHFAFHECKAAGGREMYLNDGVLFRLPEFC